MVNGAMARVVEAAFRDYAARHRGMDWSPGWYDRGGSLTERTPMAKQTAPKPADPRGGKPSKGTPADGRLSKKKGGKK
jgi:hypothetical protein